MKQLLQPLLDWYLQSLKSGGYPLVALLMAIESSIVPLPSEVVIPPAAHLAWTEGLDFLGVRFTGWSAQFGLVIAGTIGSWLGAGDVLGFAGCGPADRDEVRQVCFYLCGES